MAFGRVWQYGNTPIGCSSDLLTILGVLKTDAKPRSVNYVDQRLGFIPNSIYLYLNARSSLQPVRAFLQAVRTFSAFSDPLNPRKHCAGVHFRHLPRETSARGHFEATWLEKTWLGVTSRPPGSRKLGSGSLGSGSLRGHLARESSARGHFEATWLEKTRVGVTSRLLGSRELGSRSLRGHLARENSARGHFEGTWLKKTWLRVTSRPLGSRNSARGHFEATWLEKTFRGNYSKKQPEGAVTAPLSSASLHSASSKTRMDILGFTQVYIYIYTH
jgi:hypothetical protein